MRKDRHKHMLPLLSVLGRIGRDVSLLRLEDDRLGCGFGPMIQNLPLPVKELENLQVPLPWAFDSVELSYLQSQSLRPASH